MFKKYIEEVRRPGQKVNFLLEFLGIEIDYLSEEKAVLALPLRKHFLQGAGVVGGGILATLADEAMGHVVAANLNNDQTAATVEMNVRYLESVVSGTIRAQASVIKKGRSIIFLESDIVNEAGEVVAKASGSFLIMNRK
jgi:uncharacterized protein (TIGR00369 family)